MGFKLGTSRKATVNTVNGLNYSFINIIESIQIPRVLATAINYVIVGGGGAGGTNAGSGGGGGGINQGIINSTYYSPTGITPGVQLTITVGGGGAAAGTVSDTVNGSPGTSSTLTLIVQDPSSPGSVQTTYPALGGGAGGSANMRANVGGGWPVEFGGGSGGGTPSQATPLTPVPGYYNQGFAGGIGPSGSGSLRTTGGGGGASQVGANGVAAPVAPDVRGGKGGDGAPTWITGSNIILGGGGGGGVHNSAPIAQGGLGGGGAAGKGSPTSSAQSAGFAGNVNTGGGGGGGGGGGAGGPSALGGVGGSGIVIISHPTSYSPLPYTGSNVLVSTLAGNIVYQFYSSGTLTFS